MAIVFFDTSYVNQSISARWSRQIDQLRSLFNLYLPDFLAEQYSANRSEIKKRFTLKNIGFVLPKMRRKPIEYKEGAWFGINIKATSSFDDEIARKGAIIDNMGNAHTTAHSYKNYLKANGLVIRDWTEGTNKRQVQKASNEDVLKAMRDIKFNKS